LLLVAACAEQRTIAPGTSPPAVDLGSSSRIPVVAAHAGEGEGYDMVQQPAQPIDTNVTAKHAAKTSIPAPSQSAVDHSTIDHSTMDHSTMGHGGAPASGGQK
jgi:hypothetical protein